MSRILIIEDDPDLAELMAITLRGAGHEAQVAPDGASALQVLHKEVINLAIIDIMLPDIVGLSLCENLRTNADPTASQIPVLITSACDERAARPLALAAGANDFLAKPFSRYQLLLRVHALLASTSPQQLVS